MQLIGTALFWLGWPFHRLYLHNSTRTRPIILADGHILLVKNWISPNRWSLPGGGIRSGEQPTQAAARELKEETTLVIEPAKFKQLFEGETHQYGLYYRYICFLVELPQMLPVKKRRIENTDIRWVAVKDLANYHLMSDANRAVQTWLKG